MADNFLGTWIQDEEFGNIAGYENFVKVQGLPDEGIKAMRHMKLNLEYKKSEDGKFSCVITDGKSGAILMNSEVDFEKDQEITGIDQNKYKIKKMEMEGNTMIEDTTPVDQTSMKGSITRRTVKGDKMEALTTLKGTSQTFNVCLTKKK